MVRNPKYQARMNKTMSEKISVLDSFIEPNSTVLDFGSGASLSIYDYCNDNNHTYVPFDIDPTVIEFFNSKNITIYSDLNTLPQCDIIYMSSVVHEIFSYNNPQEINRIFKTLISKLKPNGKIVIRDFYMYNSYELDNRMELVVKKDKIEEVDSWIEKLYNKGIISEVSYANETTSVASIKDIYEIVYHSVWGLESLDYESNETYSTSIYNVMKMLSGLELTQIESYFDESYKTYLENYFEELTYRLLPSKSILVFENKEE